MKKIILLPVILLSVAITMLFNGCSPAPTTTDSASTTSKDIIGKWQGSDNFNMEFLPDGTAMVSENISKQRKVDYVWLSDGVLKIVEPIANATEDAPSKLFQISVHGKEMSITDEDGQKHEMKLVD